MSSSKNCQCVICKNYEKTCSCYISTFCSYCFDRILDLKTINHTYVCVICQAPSGCENDYPGIRKSSLVTYCRGSENHKPLMSEGDWLKLNDQIF